MGDPEFRGAADPPRYVRGELVRILDRPAAREERLVGEEAEIRAGGAPASDTDEWDHAVRPRGWDTLICFSERDLAPTGRRAPGEEPAGRTVISVRPDGTVTGACTTH